MTQCFESDLDTAIVTDAKLPPPRIQRTFQRKPNVLEWPSEPFNPVRGEKALWVAVITQALMDALSRADNIEARYHRHEATRWLTDNSKDFMLVCFYAGLDPSYVRRKAKRALATPLRWRAAPGEGKRYMERKGYRRRVKPVQKQSIAVPVIIAGPWIL